MQPGCLGVGSKAEEEPGDGGITVVEERNKRYDITCESIVQGGDDT